MQAHYQGKRVLVTGHTGFKGAWLSHWLLKLGCQVTGYSLPPVNTDNLYRLLELPKRMQSRYGDIRDLPALSSVMSEARPEMVFHLAAQSLVLPSYASPLDTFATNIIGTANVLECARRTGGVKSIVNVTTDKCYENNETGKPFSEGDKLGGYDPYSASKAAAEIVSSSYRHSFLAEAGIHMATVRAGNVIGGGDFAEYRLLPDIFRAAQAHQPVVVRHPQSVRPWQHVFDVLHGYLMIGRALEIQGRSMASAFNLGPDETGITVGVLADRFIAALGSHVKVEKGNAPTPHEAALLLLDTHKAKSILGWKPVLKVQEAVDMTAKWYGHYHNSPSDIASFSDAQLSDYRRRAAL